MSSSSLSLYNAARSSAAYYQMPAGGSMRIYGEHRHDFLQRQTSNDVGLLKPGRAVLTTLTSPVGRILDVLYLLPEPESIFALTLPGMAEDTARFLKSRIFFMDQISVDDLSQAYIQVDLFGPKSVQILTKMGVKDPPETNGISALPLNDNATRVLGLERSFGLGYRLISLQEDLAAVEKCLLDSGALALDGETYHALRVEAGVPTGGRELVEDFTPLETGLSAAVSGSKGCYTGQEVLTRQITYDKVTQSLCGLQLDDQVASGVRLWAQGNAAGKLTSVANSPRFGWIGLAVVKRQHNQPGTTVNVGEKDGSGVQARIINLPFDID